MGTRDVFSEEELSRLRGFPEITRAELIKYFTLTSAKEEFLRKWRPTKTVGDQLVTAAPRSRSLARGGPGIRSAAVLRGRGPCPDDPHLAAPEDHRAPE